jgi:hypothetical protein
LGEGPKKFGLALSLRAFSAGGRNRRQGGPTATVGWIHGSVLGEVYTKYILFVKDGDGFLYGWPGFKPEPWCKQLYIG